MRLLKEGFTNWRLEHYSERSGETEFQRPSMDRVHQETIRTLERAVDLRPTSTRPNMIHPRPRGG